MTIADTVGSERWNGTSIAMGKDKKTPRNYRFGSLAMKLIKAELAERKEKAPKGAPKTELPTETSIVEEAVLFAAAKDPRRRALLMEEVRKDPAYAFLLELLSKPENNAKG